MPSLSNSRDLVRDHPHHAADRVALEEHVHTEPALARQRVARVELELVLELLPLLLRDDRVHHLTDLRAVEHGEVGERHHLAVHAHDRVRAGGEVQVGAAPVEHLVEELVDVQLFAVQLAQQVELRPRRRPSIRRPARWRAASSYRSATAGMIS